MIDGGESRLPSADRRKMRTVLREQPFSAKIGFLS